MLQILLPELLALETQHGGSASPQPPDAEPEDPGCQLEELALPAGLFRPRQGGQAVACTSCHWRPGSWLPEDKGKIVVTFALAESVFVSALINAQ